jgi:hypothetical protein
MDFGKRGCFQRAQNLLKSGDSASLRYACLELRYCIEAICHEKVKLYRSHLSDGELNSWQPKKIMEILQELDPYVNENHTLNIWSEKPDGTRDKLVFSGSHKVLPLAILKKHYYKLGSYLHVPTISQLERQNGEKSDADLEGYLKVIIDPIKLTAANTFNSNFATTISTNCHCCGKFIIRNTESLKDNPTVKCTNSKCGAEYDVEVQENESKWQIRQVVIKCPECGSEIDIHQHLLKENYRTKCFGCGQDFVIYREWFFTKAPIDEIE